MLLSTGCPAKNSSDAGVIAESALWPRTAVLYHVYVRSFCDSDGDGHGDYAGLVSKLDYIQGLGVDGILLLPVVQNDHDEYGGYAPTDYKDSEAGYGDLAAFDRLIAEAHNRNLKILTDFPLDLASDTHPYFTSARASTTSPYHDYFNWAAAPCPSGTGFFGPAWWLEPPIGQCFWTKWGPTVPEWNYENPQVRAMASDAARFWTARGVEGFRLDSAHNIDDQAQTGMNVASSPGTHAFWKEFMSAIKQGNREIAAVAEVITDQQSEMNKYFDDGIDMVLDYPLFGGIYDALLGGSKTLLATKVGEKVARLPADHQGAIFLGNNSSPSSGRSAELLKFDTQLMKLGALLLFSLPGMPMVYYGDEIGLGGPSIEGAQKRKNPMQWDLSPGRGFTTGTPWTAFDEDSSINVASQEISGSMLRTYRALITTRKRYPALQDGSYRELATSGNAVFAFLREKGGARVLVVVNLDTTSHDPAVNLAAAGISSAKTTNVFFPTVDVPEVTPANAGAYGDTLGPHQGGWILLE